MKPAEFAKHLRRVERKIEDARDDLDTLKQQFEDLSAREPEPEPGAKKGKGDGEDW